MRGISYIEENKTTFDQGYDSMGHVEPYVPHPVKTVNEEEENIGNNILEWYAPVHARKPTTTTNRKKDSTADEVVGVFVSIDENTMDKWVLKY